MDVKHFIPHHLPPPPPPGYLPWARQAVAGPSVPADSLAGTCDATIVNSMILLPAPLSSTTRSAPHSYRTPFDNYHDLWGTEQRILSMKLQNTDSTSVTSNAQTYNVCSHLHSFVQESQRTCICLWHPPRGKIGN